MNNYILMNGYNRPEFFDIVYERLQSCRGLEDYNIFIELEANANKEYRHIIRRYTKYPSQLEVHQWETKYGLTRGHLEAMKKVMKKTDDYLINIEDDVLVSKDFLEYCEYCYDNYYKERDDIATISGAISEDQVDVDRDVNKVHKRQWYKPWGVVIPKDFFNDYVREHCKEEYYKDLTYADRVYPEWKFKGKFHLQAGLINRLIHKNDLYCIEAEKPRIQDIGWYGQNRKLNLANYKDYCLHEKIIFNKKIWSNMNMIEKFAYDENSKFILQEDHYWTDLELIE